MSKKSLTLCPTYQGRRRSALAELLRRLEQAWVKRVKLRRLRAFGSGRVHRTVSLFQPEAICIGHRVLLGAGVKLEAVSETSEPVLHIGDDCVIAPGARLQAALSLKVGDGAQIAQGVLVTDHEHVWEGPGQVAHNSVEAAPTSIGAGVWIGERAVVLRGVSIGAGSVVGAGSIVKHDVPEGCIVAGAPAKVVRRWDAASGAWQRV